MALLGTLWGLVWFGCAGHDTNERPNTIIVDVPKPRGVNTKVPPTQNEERATQEPARRDLSREEAEREEVRRASEQVASLRPKFNHCFLSHVAGLERRLVVIEFVVQRDGRASDLKLSPAFNLRPLTDCLNRVLGSARFDPPSLDIAKMRVPLKLEAP